jgi:O-antigen/teichoic acid export membrane protein
MRSKEIGLNKGRIGRKTMRMLSTISDKLHIDTAIAYTSIARIIQGIGGIFSLFFVAVFLTSEEQGYYYTFGSILAIQIFFELGLGGIITQYVAYEAAQLKLNGNIFIGQEKHISRLSSLLHLFVRWYSLISLLLLCILITTGLVFFSGYEENNIINWRNPWFILCLATALNLFISPLIAFVEGIGKVKDIAFLRLIICIFSILLVLSVLFIGGKLYASAITALMAFFISIFFLWQKGFFKLFINLWSQIGYERVNYKLEIFPYQWRIALSWISGYFIFQFFNPVLFAYSGPKIAGQMGMTLAALNGILSLVLSWTSTKVPLWSSCISRKEYECLDKSFNIALKSSTLVATSCILLFIVFLAVLAQVYKPLYDRFLPFVLSSILLLTVIINNIVNAWATYLRCHKKEPFLIQAVVIGFLCAVSTVLFGKYVGAVGIVWGYVSIVFFISFPLSYYIFKTKKKEYHGK